MSLALVSSLVSLTPPLVSGIFQQNFNGSKIELFSSRERGNFRGLEASRPRTSKCVLEDVFEAKDVLEDSTSGVDYASVNGSITSGSSVVVGQNEPAPIAIYRLG